MDAVQKPSPESNVSEMYDYFQSNNTTRWKINDLTELLLSACRQYEDLYKETVTYKSLLDEKDKRLSSTREEYTNLYADNKKYQQNLDRQLADKKEEISKLEVEITNLKYKLKAKDGELNSIKSEPLPFLARVFPGIFGQTERELSKLRLDIKKYEQNANNYWTEYQKLQTHNKEIMGKHERDKQEWNREKEALNSKLNKLEKTVDEQLGQIARLSDKPSEQLGNEEREYYQIIEDYKSFCQHNGLEPISEDIYSAILQSQDNSCDPQKWLFNMAKIKSTLSSELLMKAYLLQLKGRRKREPVSFDDFFDSYLKNCFSGIVSQNSLADRFKKTAQKGFNIITQLMDTNPPCQLFIADENGTINLQEYDVERGCPKDGIVKFTIFPGICSGYEVYEKPLVFTE